MNRAGLALGTNLGDRENLIVLARDACARLDASMDGLMQSFLYATEPVDCPEGSQGYLNAVVEIGWDADPHALLAECRLIEERFGRRRSATVNEPRTIDVDLLYVGDLIVHDRDLELPHPRLSQRKFVLTPLRDIRPLLIIPGQTDTVSALLSRLDGSAEPDPVLLTRDW